MAAARQRPTPIVQTALSPAELEALHRRVNRGQPYGDADNALGKLPRDV